MVSERATLNIEVDSLYALLQLDLLQKKANEVGASVVEVRKQADKEFLQVMRKGRRVVSGLRQIFIGLGATLDPLFDAFLTTIGAALESVLVTHRVLEAGTAGLSATLTIGLSMAAVSVAAVNLLNIATLREDTMESVNRSLSLISGLEAIFS
ncbi:MAG: hypothetical protein ACXADF_17695 [Candidatus Thorarchaeota archaeon]